MENKEYSGERFIPEMNDPELEIEHLERYYAAQKIVKGMDVLDAACGEGYGSNILARCAKTVVGIDIDQETLNNAKTKYAGIPNLRFFQGSIADLSIIEASSKDAVVSYETIEHVDRGLQEAFLKEIKRILKPNGILIMSTPDKREYSDRYQFHNEFHLAEFYVDEFISFLKQEFQYVKLFNQYLEVASFIDQSGVDEEEVPFIKDSHKYSPKGKYVIALASNSPLQNISLSTVLMHHREEYLPTLDELNYCRHEAITCRKKIENLETDLSENRLQKAELEQINQALRNEKNIAEELNKQETAQIEILTSQLNKKITELNEQSQILKEKDAIIEDMQSKIHLKDSEIQKIRSLSLMELITWHLKENRH